MFDPEMTLNAAEDVCRILQQCKISAVVIGATALAAYNYARQTEGIDLGVNADLATLRSVLHALQNDGYTAELREPDDNDPLGGVIDVTGDFGLLQIVSYADRFPAVIEDAIANSSLTVRSGSPLKLTPIPQLIAMKLYAGGYKSKADIVELLRRNPEIDTAQLKTVCKRYRLRGLDELINEAF